MKTAEYNVKKLLLLCGTPVTGIDSIKEREPKEFANLVEFFNGMQLDAAKSALKFARLKLSGYYLSDAAMLEILSNDPKLLEQLEKK